MYDKIANELEKTISMIANKLGTSESNIRISLDYLWDDLKGNKAKKKGMSIQVKTDDAQWKEAWTGNALIMQTQNGEGIVIPSNPFFGIKVEGQKNPKVRSLFNKALDLDLEDLAASENARIADSLSPEEIKLIAPNTPVIVTGTQSRLNEEENNTLTQEDFNILKDKGFNAELNTQHDFIWIERQSGLKKADWRYLNNLLVKKDIPFEVKYWRGDGDKGQSKEIWIEKKYISQ